LSNALDGYLQSFERYAQNSFLSDLKIS